MGKLNESLVLQDINSCCEFLNTRDYIKRNIHGVVGYGMGGSYALRFACQRKRCELSSREPPFESEFVVVSRLAGQVMPRIVPEIPNFHVPPVAKTSRSCDLQNRAGNSCSHNSASLDSRISSSSNGGVRTPIHL